MVALKTCGTIGNSSGELPAGISITAVPAFILRLTTALQSNEKSMVKAMKLLILEDDVHAALMQLTLKRAGLRFSTKIVSTRQEFIQALDSFAPEVIISDHQLPQFNSTQALKICREKAPYLPFILVTGSLSDQFGASIIKEGADDYILKNNLERLPIAIQQVIEKKRSEKAQALLVSIVNSSDDAIISISLDGIITSWNNAAELLFGYEPEEVTGKSISLLIAPGKADEEPGIMARIKRGELVQNYETERVGKNGDLKHIALTVSPIKDKLGNIIGASKIVRDISKQREAEKQKEFDHNNLHALINNTSDLVWSVDRNLRLITFNQAFNEKVTLITGNKPVRGSSVLNQPAERFPNPETLYKRAFTGEAFTTIEQMGSTGESWSEISFYPIHEGTKVIGTACFSRDITQRKIHENIILKSEEQYRDLVNNISDLICTHDMDGNILSVNSATEKLLEMKFDEQQHLNIKQMLLPHEETAFDNYINNLRNNGFATGLIKIRSSSGKIRIWEYNNTLKITASLPVVRGYARDITENRKAEGELQRSEMRLNEAQAISHISSWEIDLVQNVHTWSDELYRIFGLNKGEVQPSIKLFLSFVHPENTYNFKKKIYNSFDSFTDSSLQFRFFTRPGVLRYGYTQWKFEFGQKQQPLRVYGIFQDITEHKAAAEAYALLEKKILEQKIQEQRKIARAIIKAQEKERNRIGQELHDNINQILAGTKIYLGIAGNKNAQIKDLVKYPMELIDSSIEEIRLLCHKLVIPLKNIQLEALIRKLFNDISQHTDIKTHISYAVESDIFPDDLKLNIFRIIQEQTDDIIKYSEAKNIAVDVKQEGKSINLFITDDGNACKSRKKRKTHGILNMINRIKSFNGDVIIERKAGVGCKMQISIPFKH